MRDPIGRATSHYLHNWAAGREQRPIDEALGTLDENNYLLTGRYAWQLAAFFECYPAERILVVRSAGLLAHLVERYPAARLTIACGPAAAPLFEAIPNLETIISLEKRRRSAHWLALWSRCAGKYWHLVVDLRRTGLAYLLPTFRRRLLGPGEPGLHKVRQYARALDLEEAAPRIWTTIEHERRAQELIPDGAPVLGLGPTANWAPKTWPAENFAELAGRLTAPGGILPGAPIALFGAAAERANAEAVRRALPTDACIDLVGGIDLATVAACIARCALYIGNDSGLMHMAAAAGTPTLGLFGPSPAARYAPWGAHTAVAQTAIPYQALVGAAGFDHRKPDNLMVSLGVDEVERAAVALWRQRPVRAA